MTPEIVKGFAREFINDPSARTKERKQIIAKVYKSLTDGPINSTCDTCLIEAIFKILSLMEKKPCSYRLQKGALLRVMGDESKTCTNDNLTDELAEFHLRTNPGCRKYFTVISANFDPDPEATAARLKAEADEAAKKEDERKAEEERLKAEDEKKAEDERLKAEAERLANMTEEEKLKEAARIAEEEKIKKEQEDAAKAKKEEAAKKAREKKANKNTPQGK